MQKITFCEKINAVLRRAVISVIVVACLLILSFHSTLADVSWPSDLPSRSLLDPRSGYPALYDPATPYVIAPCVKPPAALTGNFQTDPCKLARDSKPFPAFSNALWADPLAISDNFTDNYGGIQFATFLKAWWKDEFLPHLKIMTAQLYGARIDATRQIGSMLDAQNLSRTAISVQKHKRDETRRETPHELSCVAGSFSNAMSQSSRLSNALTTGYKQDIAKRSANAPGTTAEKGPVVEQKTKWDEYCNEFQDVSGNNAINACVTPIVAGGIVNGDVNVEGLLLKDTIDMANPHENKAILAIMQNLVQPKVKPRIPESVINTATGKQWILTQQHLESARNIASDVVASIISRRTGLTAAPAPAACTPKTYTDFLAALKAQESSNRPGQPTPCLGLYQFCEITLIDLGCKTNPKTPPHLPSTWTGSCSGITSTAAFLASPAAQEALVLRWMQKIRNYIMSKGLDSYIGETDIKGTVITWSGMLAAAHLSGYPGLERYLVGNRNPSDGHTRPSDYMRQFAGYQTPFGPAGPCGGSLGTGYASALLKAIRVKAGIPLCSDPWQPVHCVSDNPSYNEIMLAMTKERFFDPGYFVHMQAVTESIKQEEASISTYVTMQYQDIYKLQEQINTLLAARAALKFSTDVKAGQVEMTPVK